MAKTLFKPVILLFTILINEGATSQNMLWAWLTSEGSANSEYVRGIAVDSHNNSYVVGNYKGSSLVVAGEQLTNNGDHDVFLIKYNSAGVAQWVRHAGGPSYDYVKSVEVDSDDNIYIVGYYNDVISFGDFELRPHPNSTFSGAGTFVVKYNPLGDVIWVRGSESPIFSDAPGIDFSMDDSNNLYLYGLCGHDFAIGGVSLSSESGGAFVVKMDSSGTAIWAKSLMGIGFIGGGISTDSDGNIYVSGSMDNDNLVVEGDTLYNVLDSDFFIVKLDNTGALQWMRGVGGTGDEVCTDISVCSNGNATLVGWSDSPTLVIGETTYTNNSGYDAYAIQFDTNGNVNWSFSAPSLLFYSTDVDINDNVYVAGSGITVMKFNDTGTQSFIQSGGYGNDEAYAVTISPQNEVYLGGTFYSSSIGSGSFVMTNQGIFDLFVGKLTSSSTYVEEKQTDSLNIYPNPSHDFINVEIEDNDEHVFTLRDIMGKLILSETFRDPVKIDIRNCSNGIYFACLYFDNKEPRIIKIIKD